MSVLKRHNIHGTANAGKNVVPFLGVLVDADGIGFT